MIRPLMTILLCVLLTGCWGPVSGIPVSLAGNALTQEQRFTLMDLQGQAVSLDQVLSQKKAVLIDFWATWCGYCVEEMPDLVKLQQKYGESGFTVLAVNVGESREQAAAFKEKMGLNFPIVLDTDSVAAQAYNVVGIPFTVLVDSTGKVVDEYHSYSGKIEADVIKTLGDKSS